MVDEPTDATYNSTMLAQCIEEYPMADELGEQPYTWDTSDSPPTKDANEDWIPTYDLNAAAGDIWAEKASAVAEDFTFSADGGSYDRSKVYEQYMRQARYYRSRRSMKTVKAGMYPRPDAYDNLAWVANVAESD
jgi:hypothetical protein